MKISDIFVVKTGQRIIEEEVYANKGDFPCITSQTTNDGITWRANKEWLLKEHKSAIIDVEECITWTKDGAKCGTLFYRNYSFYPNDHCGVLIPKKEYKNNINLKWFLYTKQEYIKGFVSQQGSQGMLYNNEMSEIEIDYPFPSKERVQDKIVEQYDKLLTMKSNIGKEMDTLNELLKYEPKAGAFITYTIGTLYTTSRGNVISEEDIYNNYMVGGIPVYSSQTADNGCLGTINTDFYNNSDKKGQPDTITWTTDGANAGKVFYRNENYLYTNVCGKLTLRKEFIDLIDNKYTAYILNTKTHIYLNAQSSNPKLMSNQMEQITISIPIDTDGKIDINKQKEFVKQYEKIENIQNKLMEIELKIDYIFNL